MPIKNTGTEQLIKDTAKRLLFAEGRLHATTQDIADAAGMNRAAVHYYFRTRDQLIAAIFQEGMQALSLRMAICMESQSPLREKTAHLIDVFLEDMIAFPYQETFLVTQINTLGQQLMEKINSGPVNQFLDQVKQEMDLGNIEQMHPFHFLMNLFSLLSFPLIMAPLYKQLFQIPEKDFKTLLDQRKQVILKLIFR